MKAEFHSKLCFILIVADPNSRNVVSNSNFLPNVKNISKLGTSQKNQAMTPSKKKHLAKRLRNASERHAMVTLSGCLRSPRSAILGAFGTQQEAH